MSRSCTASLVVLLVGASACYPSLPEAEECSDPTAPGCSEMCSDPADPGCSEEVTLDGHYDLTRVGDDALPAVALEGGGVTLTIVSGSMDVTAEGEMTGSFELQRSVDGATSMETDWFAGTYVAEGTWIELAFSDLLLGDDRSDEGSLAGNTFSFVLSASNGELTGSVFVFFTLDPSFGSANQE